MTPSFIAFLLGKGALTEHASDPFPLKTGYASVMDYYKARPEIVQALLEFDPGLVNSAKKLYGRMNSVRELLVLGCYVCCQRRLVLVLYVLHFRSFLPLTPWLCPPPSPHLSPLRSTFSATTSCATETPPSGPPTGLLCICCWSPRQTRICPHL